MNIIGRLTGETVLVAMNNEEAATLLTMEAAKEVEERAARLCAAQIALLRDAAAGELAEGKALFRISGMNRRGIKYTTHERDPVKAAEAFDRYRTVCVSVKLEFPVPRG